MSLLGNVKKKVSKMIGYYLKSARNNMVSDSYEEFGFQLSEVNSEDTIWKLELINYEIKLNL